MCRNRSLFLFIVPAVLSQSTAINSSECNESSNEGDNKTCSPLYSTSTITFRCYDSHRLEISCEEATDGATAKYECSPYYESLEIFAKTRYCKKGLWNLPAPRCIPVCGRKIVSRGYMTLYNQNVTKMNYPWVTTVFQKFDIMGVYKFACGGTLLSPRVIMTAAHCVWDQFGDGLVSVDLVKVGAGKYYRLYGDERDIQAQYRDVFEILVDSRYRGSIRAYANDIAFLVTKEDFWMSAIIQPACYHNLDHIQLYNGWNGVFVGWDTNDELKETTLSYNDEDTCSKKLPTDFTKYYTNDKFCRGYSNDSLAIECYGNSGGGLFFENPLNKRFYVHGILSIGRRNPDDVDCSPLFTKVAIYYNWLEYVVEYQHGY